MATTAATEDGAVAPSATFVHCTPVYARNLDERVKIPTLTETLRELFEEYGTILEIVAKKNVKARGQAFIVFDSVEAATEAIEEVNGFEVFGRPLQLAFARSRSDATVVREDGEEGLEAHKRRRLAEKERKQALEAAQKPAKRPAAENLAERPAKSAKAAPAAGGVVPDEYLPPNKTLFLRDLPEDYGKDGLSLIFSRFPGFKEVRMVPGRKGIAFVEYEGEDGAIAAKERTAGMTLGETVIKVTYQRQ